MAKFRRKPIVTWLPNDFDPLLTDDSIIGNFIHDVGAFPGTDRVTSVHPVTFDQPAEVAVAAGEQTSLADFEGSAYRLRRIVGKCFINCAQNGPVEGNTQGVNFLCTAGFIILRVDAITGDPLVLPAAFEAYSPTLFGAERDPWIWRRSWMLSNEALLVPQANWPHTNAEYGSLADGPHIDQKTARRVSDEERLFFVASSEPTLRTGGQTVSTNGITWNTDLRVLASPLKASGNRRNASR